ncbi:MAG: carboxypeptidase-like regulatory domain-containing protein [Gemmatimonadota bacterium]|nr:carboxypeptidase-like regulatory domain-containing protein [Gemmatimonadota bacterium]
MLIAAALVVVAGSVASAQGTEPNVSGRVLSAAGIPIAGIEVQLEGTTFTTRTDTRGRFAFTDAPGGPQDVVVRGIGYLPARAAVRIPERSLDVTITVLAQPAALDTVTVREKITVLSGIVVDERDQPVPGATVQIASSDRRTVTTGEDGWFTITGLRAGTIVFRVTKDGYFMANTAVRLTEWRGVIVRLETLPERMGATARGDRSGTSNNAIIAWRDAALRMSMRGGRSVVISSDDLAPFANMALGEAILHLKAATHLTTDLTRARTAICVVQDGRRAIGSTTLDTWRADEVEMIELYPPGTDASGTIARYLRSAGCRAEVSSQGRSRGAFYAVLWMK